MIKEFRNYKELCRYLGEDTKSGNSKIAQMKRWKTQFDFHTEGYKIIIDKMYSNTTKKADFRRGGNNHTNMDIYLPYIYRCLYKEFPNNMSIVRIMCDTLKLLNIETLQKIYNSDENFGLNKVELAQFKAWVNRVGRFVGDNIAKSLKKLQKDHLIEYHMGYAFISRPDRIKYIAYTDEYNDQIQEIEAQSCDYINKKYHLSSKRKGKQLYFLIMKNKKLLKLYKKTVIKLIVKNSSIMDTLQHSIDSIFYGIDFGSDTYPISGYWKVWSVTEVEPPQEADLAAERAKYVDLILKKTAKGRKIPSSWMDLVFMA